MGSVAKLKFKEAKVPDALKLELGAWSGRTTPEGFKPLTVDQLKARWPYKDASVDEAECNFVLQFLTMVERINFFNELYRVLKPSGTCLIVTPHWCASKAYGHPLFQMPPVSEYFYPMLKKQYREQQRDHDKTFLTCDFEHTLGYGLHPAVVTRASERQQEQVSFNKEAAQDLIVTLIKPG